VVATGSVAATGSVVASPLAVAQGRRTLRLVPGQGSGQGRNNPDQEILENALKTSELTTLILARV
jgi:hypothetical protein